MNIPEINVTYSSIVKIGEDVQKLEEESGLKYLKLHRGVMDVTNIDINSLNLKLNFNDPKLQQYTGNDGYPELVKKIKDNFNLENHQVIVTPGGMAALDLIINSLGDENVYIPNFHWGSWNKILKTHNKKIYTFDDFDLKPFIDSYKHRKDGIVMLCYPSNPTGYTPSLETIKDFLNWTKENNTTVILDLPYYHLFNKGDDGLVESLHDNVILVSSFSKSLGLSGYRVGYIATKNKTLFKVLRTKALYKWNSTSILPQYVISKLLDDKKVVENYKNETIENIKKNIDYLEDNNLLFDNYTQRPIGPFAVINVGYEQLLNWRISSVPLNNFANMKKREHENCSRISVAVRHELFKEYFDKMFSKEKPLF